MKVLMAHNFYQQPGGEDRSFAAEAALLEANGHTVTRFTVHNDEIEDMSRFGVATKTVWNRQAYRSLRALLAKDSYDIVHFQNTFPLISPAAYYAARDSGAAVVQSLRNYRFSCVNGLFFRDGQVCEDCLGQTVPWQGVLHSCYRGSRSASGVVAAMLAYHKLRRTYHEMVDVYIALSEFSKQKFIEAGLPPGKIVVKPNFVEPDSGVGTGNGHYALFVGRLSSEKGMDTLLNAWRVVGSRLPLKIVGNGPMADEVDKARKASGNIEWLEQKPLSEVYDLMGNAMVLLFPSECYETFGRVAVEAYAKGTPVIASSIGAIAELVDHGFTGLLFTPGDSAELADAVNWLLGHPDQTAAMRRSARAEYEAKYTAEANYQQLMDIYEQSVEVNRAR